MSEDKVGEAMAQKMATLLPTWLPPGWRAPGPIDQIAPALVAICGELSNPERGRAVNVETKKGGRYSYSYAELSAYFDVLRPICSKNGVAVLQPLTWRDGKPYVVTLLLHTSGQSIDHETPAIVDGEERMSSAQALQSAITYAKRTGLGIFPMHPEHEDDDGNAAGGNAVSSAPACPKCKKADRVIRSKYDPLAWYCLADKTAFSPDAPPEEAGANEPPPTQREPGEDDGPPPEPERKAAEAPRTQSGPSHNCPTCQTAGRETKYTKTGDKWSRFCPKCRKQFNAGGML